MRPPKVRVQQSLSTPNQQEGTQLHLKAEIVPPLDRILALSACKGPAFYQSSNMPENLQGPCKKKVRGVRLTSLC